MKNVESFVAAALAAGAELGELKPLMQYAENVLAAGRKLTAGDWGCALRTLVNLPAESWTIMPIAPGEYDNAQEVTRFVDLTFFRSISPLADEDMVYEYAVIAYADQLAADIARIMAKYPDKQLVPYVVAESERTDDPDVISLTMLFDLVPKQ